MTVVQSIVLDNHLRSHSSQNQTHKPGDDTRRASPDTIHESPAKHKEHTNDAEHE